MPLFGHRHVRRQISPGNPLSGRTVYIPTMGEGSPEAFAAAFRWLGVNAQPTPLSDERTRELGAKYTSGDECYPAKVTVGDFLRVIEQPGFDPDRTSFFMPTADGPCRFGQYAPFLRKILNEAGYGRVQVLSPTSQNGYEDLGRNRHAFPAHGMAGAGVRGYRAPRAAEDPPLRNHSRRGRPGLSGVAPGCVCDG